VSNLIAYIPTLNPRHKLWFEKHKNATLCLISQTMAESIYSSFARNMAAMPTSDIVKMIEALKLVDRIIVYDPEDEDLDLTLPQWNEWVASDEDVVHTVVETYFIPVGAKVQFEETLARWDMSAVKAAQPVIPDCEVSRSELDVFRMRQAEDLTRKSPDWWRQIGAIAFRGSELLACGWNEHFPTMYETYIFGDTRLNFNAGDPAGMEAYLSLHAEEYLIAYCAEHGLKLQGASLYINTFPCGRCARAVSKSGIKELFFREGSSFLKGFEILKDAGIRIVQVREDPESA